MAIATQSPAKPLMRISTLALLHLVLLSSTAQAWNALGHKVVCEIAWQQIDQPTRDKIVATLRRHPRFDEDFAKKGMPIEDQERWIFWQAGTWPDIARGIKGPDRGKFNKPTWHYVNYPLFLGPERPVTVNLSERLEGPNNKWNVLQATQYSLNVIQSDASPSQKGLAYSWLFHLVADMHQPLHSTALYSEEFPEGDKGGNSIKVIQGRNLHSLWDNLLGKSHKPSNVMRAVQKLKADRELWEVDNEEDVAGWVLESHELAKRFTYSPEILESLQERGADEAVSSLSLTWSQQASMLGLE